MVAPRFWGLAAHTGPISSLGHDHLWPMGVRDVRVHISCIYCKYHQKDFGVSCRDLPRMHNMKQYLKNPVAGIDALRTYEQRVLRAAQKSAGFATADVLLCQFPPAACSAFLPSASLGAAAGAAPVKAYGGKRVILELGWRFDMQRHGEAACEWTAHIAAVLRDSPRHLVIAHTAYDIAYVHHFTGLGHKVHFIEYTSSRWMHVADTVPREMHHVDPTILLLPDRRGNSTDDPDQKISRLVRAVLDVNYVEAKTARELYDRYTPAQILHHRAAIAIPYSAYSFQLADWYWLGMTIFVPTPRFLAHLHHEIGVMYELLEYCHRATPPQPCKGCPAPGWSTNMSGHLWDPQDMWVHPKGAEHWFSLFWIYHVPHVRYFSSLGDLVEQVMALSASEARRSGRQIRARNRRVLKTARHQWHALLTGMLATP
eukprot:TRINITY_DN15440_c0_g1_i1.p1 TRINITY_DN15440_c0_g1~~TRINITY_DN15440_c0_g1_i1.p1  ORF type:complete len:427 (+),score=34.86 TRINITY_DN15440_c0_g1_i1:356-1636(+)